MKKWNTRPSNGETEMFETIVRKTGHHPSWS